MEHSHPVLLVPVRRTETGVCALPIHRRPDGTRCAIAFTSAAAAARVVGPDQELVELSLDTLHTMLDPLGVARVQVDPDLVAPAAGHGRAA